MASETFSQAANHPGKKGHLELLRARRPMRASFTQVCALLPNLQLLIAQQICRCVQAAADPVCTTPRQLLSAVHPYMLLSQSPTALSALTNKTCA